MFSTDSLTKAIQSVKPLDIPFCTKEVLLHKRMLPEFGDTGTVCQANPVAGLPGAVGGWGESGCPSASGLGVLGLSSILQLVLTLEPEHQE